MSAERADTIPDALAESLRDVTDRLRQARTAAMAQPALAGPCRRALEDLEAELVHLRCGAARHVSVAEARRDLSDLLNRCAYSTERIVIERHGKAVAALVGIEDLALLERLETEDDALFAVELEADPALRTEIEERQSDPEDAKRSRSSRRA